MATTAKKQTRVPEEYADGMEKARAARVNVAAQFADLLLDAEQTGSIGLLGMRLRALAEARVSGDLVIVRAAVMELTVAGGSYAAAIDLSHPRAARA